MQMVSFLLLLFPVFLPVMQKFYVRRRPPRHDGPPATICARMPCPDLMRWHNGGVLMRYAGARACVCVCLGRVSQDGIIVSVILNCCRKKFSLEAAMGAVIIFILALPSFAAKLFGVSAGNFNVAKLSGSVKSTIADLNKMRKAKKQEVKTKRVVKRRVMKRRDDDDGAYLAAGGAGVGLTAAAQQKREVDDKDADAEAEADDDGGDGDDGGGDGGD